MVATKKLIIGIIVAIVILSTIGVYYLGTMPVHRTNISKIDPVETSSIDSNIDIVSYKSTNNGSNIDLELTVAGVIRTDIHYRYELMVIAREIGDNQGAVFSFRYENGTASDTFGDVNLNGYQAFITGNTLKIVFSKTTLGNMYMVGLEAVTFSTQPGISSDSDTTPSDRDNPIERNWF
jgi:hypothetical protein